ncbi:restriction endonuclease subunit S [uncultured Streptococcus sp.]|uniref:restriction endonuclease subunit S n=1 Tax=uncultured Streptococcus sp. TaxID=83427 RepID=UPI0028D89412|nr:restriction endonuclease subunit S [uncultured Streptococcus sp.]
MKALLPKIKFKNFDEKWNRKKLHSIAPLRGGFAFKSEKFQNTGIPVVRISNIKFDGTVGGEFEYYSKIIPDEKFVLRGRSILLAMSGATTGKIAMLDSEKEYYQNQRVGYFQNTGEVDYDFLPSVLQTKAFTNQLNAVLVAGAQPNISSKEIDSFEFCIPDSIDEQSAIGSLFRTLDDLLASYKDNLINYQSLKATMLSKMFPKAGQTVPEIRLDGFEEEWGKDTLEPYLTESRISGDTGLTAKKITVKLWGKGVIEKKEKYAGSSNTQYFIRKGGQFIYSKLDFQNQAFGIIPNELNGYQSTLDLPTFDIQNIDSKFLLEYVMRREFYEYQGLIANGSRKAKRIHPEDFLVMPVRIPSIEEQQAIGAYFSNLDNLINSHQEKITQLETLKKKLLQDMFI